MNYKDTDLIFKIRKICRYLALYGLSRTYIKVRGALHMHSSSSFNSSNEWVNPNCKLPSSTKRNVAIVGCGNFSYSCICFYLKKINKNFLKYAYDIDKSKSFSLCKSYNGYCATTNFNKILSDKKVTHVFIASNHASHMDFALQAIRSNKIVHIEKPHVVNYEQLYDFKSTTSSIRSNVFLGFNRPRSPLFKKLCNKLIQEKGPLMINWFIAGHEIPDNHWYFDEKEGGRVLGNLCHWTDLTLHLVGLENAFPCVITSGSEANSKSDFIVNITFADHSCATISFSAKGHTFEGVRESLQVHKGDLLAHLQDFHILKWEKLHNNKIVKLLFRDHGHFNNIRNSYTSSSAENTSYIIATASFFLSIKESIENNKKITLSKEQALLL